MFSAVHDLERGSGVINIRLHFPTLNASFCTYLNKNIEGKITHYIGYSEGIFIRMAMYPF